MSDTTTCRRCGLEYPTAGQLTLSGTCAGVDRLACRDREIAGLRAKVTEMDRAHRWLLTAANGLIGAMVNEGPGAETDAAFNRLQTIVDKHWDDEADAANAEAAGSSRAAEPPQSVGKVFAGFVETEDPETGELVYTPAAEPPQPARPWVPAPGETLRRTYDGVIVKALKYEPTGYVRYELADGSLGSDHIRSLVAAEPPPVLPGQCGRLLVDGQTTCGRCTRMAHDTGPCHLGTSDYAFYEPPPAQAEGRWIRTGEHPEPDSFAWVVWNGVVQDQPWQWTEHDDEPDFMFDGHSLPMSEVDAYQLIPFPPPPATETK